MGPKVEAACRVRRGDRQARGDRRRSTEIEQIVDGDGRHPAWWPEDPDERRSEAAWRRSASTPRSGKLRKVMVHRPELSLQRLTPTNHDDLLFDDVLWVERAQYEHDQFVARMRERGVEVFLLQDLLAEALAASDGGRQRLIELVGVASTPSGLSLVDEVRARACARLKPDAARAAPDRRAHRRRVGPRPRQAPRPRR